MISQERVADGREPLFQSHMWDGSAVPLDENLKIADELLTECAKAHIVMEVEIGVVGGEEDGVANAINEKLYTTPEDALRTAEVLGTGERGRYMLAATFGNVHGVYKPGHVKLRPGVLKDIQDAVGAKYGKDKPFDLVFHGGSGSDLADMYVTSAAYRLSAGQLKKEPHAGATFVCRPGAAGMPASSFAG